MNFTQTIFSDVQEFYKGQRITIPNQITPLTKERQGQRDLFLLEEYRELKQAIYALHDTNTKDELLLALCEVYDAFADILYIAAGTLLEKGDLYKQKTLNHYEHLPIDMSLQECLYSFLVLNTKNEFLFMISTIYSYLHLGTLLGTHENSEKNPYCLIDCWSEVHLSNLSKRLPDGSYLYNEYDKIIKPNKFNNEFAHEYSKPDLLPIIQRYFA